MKLSLEQWLQKPESKLVRPKKTIIGLQTIQDENCETCNQIQSYAGGIQGPKARYILHKNIIAMTEALSGLHKLATFKAGGICTFTAQADMFSKMRSDLIMRIREYRKVLRHSDYFTSLVWASDNGLKYKVIGTRYVKQSFKSVIRPKQPNKYQIVLTDADKPMVRYKSLLITKRDMVRHNRKIRQANKPIPRTVPVGGRENHTVTVLGSRQNGFVYSTGEQILTIMHSRKARMIFDPKSPKDQQRYVGVEMEFTCSANNKTLAGEFGKINLQGKLQLKEDGSIRVDKSDHYPHELCILALESEVEMVVNSVCGVLAKYNAKVNKSCGLHVHLDMRTRDKDVAFSNLVTAQPLLYAMNPPSRAVNKFCKKSTKKQFGANVERYFGVNAQAYHKYQTIEIRIHSGTVLAEKINNWVKVLLCIVNKQEKIARAPRKFTTFVKHFDFDMALAEYVAGRIEKFIGASLEVEEAA